jgi:hypothetical protein
VAAVTSYYLAGRYSDHARIAACAQQIRAWGGQVTSTWHDLPNDGAETALTAEQMAADPSQATAYAVRDAEDLRAADALILFTAPEGGKAGRYTELGIAIERRMLIAVVGPQANIFTAAFGIRYDTWEEFAAANTQFARFFKTRGIHTMTRGRRRLARKRDTP